MEYHSNLRATLFRYIQFLSTEKHPTSRDSRFLLVHLKLPYALNLPEPAGATPISRGLGSDRGLGLLKVNRYYISVRFVLG